MKKEHSLITKVIIELGNELKQKYPSYKGIYLYGSRARGNYSADSDYDMVITFDKEIDWRFESGILGIVYNYIVEYEILIDCKVYNNSEIINPDTPFRLNVKNEGIFYGI